MRNLGGQEFIFVFLGQFFLVLVLWHIKVCDVENSQKKTPLGKKLLGEQLNAGTGTGMHLNFVIHTQPDPNQNASDSAHSIDTKKFKKGKNFV